jgi:hypothetical protein
MVGRATMLADFRVLSLSEGGAALEISVPLVVGSQCDLSLSLRQLPVDLKARVANVDGPSAEGLYRVGVEFVSIDTADREMLRSFLEWERGRHE